MAGPDGVNACGLQDLQLPFRGAAADSRSQCPEIVMQADTLQLEVPPIQQKPFVFFESNGANAERADISVNDAISTYQFRDQAIQVRVLHVPAFRSRDDQATH